MNKTVATLLMTIFCMTTLFSQTTKIAEIESKLQKPLSDTARLGLLRKLSIAYSPVDPVQKFRVAKKYKSLAEKLGLDSIAAEGYIDMGISYGIQSRLDSALFYFSKGYEKSVANDYPKGTARSLVSIGFVYARLDDKQGAVKKYREALEIFKKLKILPGINQCYMNIGSIYFDMFEYKRAESYFMASYKSYKEANDQERIAGPMFSLGNTNRMLGNLDVAKDFYTKSLQIREKTGDLNGIALARWGLGMIAIRKKQYDEALVDLKIALDYDIQIKDAYHQTAVIMSISEAYLGKKDYAQAEKFGKQALQIASEIKSRTAKMDAFLMLTTIAKETKNSTKALDYQSNYLIMRDSIQAEKAINDIKISEFERVQFDIEKLEKDNETISSKNLSYFTTIIIISILLLIVILLLVLLYKKNLKKHATNKLLEHQKNEIATINKELSELNEELTVQMQLTASQNDELERLNIVKNKFFSIVSHDLRSPLATLQMLFRLYRRGQLSDDEMNEMLNSLEETIYMTTVFLDNLLNWSKSQLEGMNVKPSHFDLKSVIDENYKLLETQIQLKGLKVENLAKPETMVFADINMVNVVVRNLISNSVKFCSKDDLIKLKTESDNEKVRFIISDTGPGISAIDVEHLFNLEHTVSVGTSGETGHHIGLILCKDMIEQNKGSIRVESQLGKGTTFFVELPINENL